MLCCIHVIPQQGVQSKKCCPGKKVGNMEIGHNTIYVNKTLHARETTLPILQELSKQKDSHYHLDIGNGDKRE